MSAGLTIRFAKAADAGEIHAALLHLAAHVGEVDRVVSTADDILRFGFGDAPAFECLIAEIGGETAGICLFFRSFSTWYGRPGVYVQDLVVYDRFRGGKAGARVGERLLRRTAAIARSRGWVYMRLSVDHENPTAMGFYRRLGLVHRFDDHIYAAYGKTFEALAAEPEEPA